jgi:signal transduction histidine kinase
MQAGVCVVSQGSGQLLYGNPLFLWLAEEPDAPCLLLPGLRADPEHDDLASEFTLQDGKQWFQMQRRRLEWVSGESAWLVILTDVTEEREREGRAQAQQERFQTTSRLIAMGEMASSLAHELNQPLTAISTYSAGLARRLPDTLELPIGVRDAVSAISQQAQRAGQIIKSIRAFVKSTNHSWKRWTRPAWWRVRPVWRR